ncbi:MAG: class I SAM-dependent methyltransferase [Planctomycetota bacterium]|nr:MAG: class I SAM-dependent methyltransferase [Planctomycetota bacterium]
MPVSEPSNASLPESDETSQRNTCPEAGGSPRPTPTRTVEVPCDLCGRTSFEVIATRDRHGRPLQTALCRCCGLVRHAELPSEQELAAFYAKEYRLRYHDEWTPSARRVMRAWKNAARIHRQLQPFLPATDRQRRSLLDVGSGIGCLPKLFEQTGWDAHGIEPNEGFQAYGKTRLRAPVERADLQSMPTELRWDVVTLVHVIEHLRSPRAALADIHRRLQSDGLLYVECPNLAAPHAVRSRLFHYAHIFNFTPVTLTWLARSVGFEPVMRFGHPDDANLQMLFKRSEPQRVGFDDRGYRTTIDALLRAQPRHYYARPFYWYSRCRKLLAYAWEHLTANTFVQRLERRLADPPEPGSLGPSAARAA